MKKTALSAILAVLCLSSIVSCGDSTAAKTPADTQASTETEAVTEAVDDRGYGCHRRNGSRDRSGNRARLSRARHVEL